jgi:two-component system response regulator HydG
MELLKNHSWPGNIRELENVIEHAFVIETTNEITPPSLPESVAGSLVRRAGLTVDLDDETISDDDMIDAEGEILATGSFEIPLPGKGFTLDINRLDFQANKEEFERQFLISALKAFKGRINQTALHANIPKKTLLRKLQKYGIIAKEYIDQAN